jgi:DNA-3-methyladenine glycosylase
MRQVPAPALDDAAVAPLPRSFFTRPAPALARALLGCLLVHDTDEGRVAGRIVETEAYDQSEPASHSSHGLTARTRVMFGPAGHLYVYFSYGVHWCANVVAGRKGRGAAVLLRAVEPVLGLELMARLRGLAAEGDPRRLASGPGRLTQALGIDGSLDGADLCAGPVFIAGRPEGTRPRVAVTKRIGITKAADLPWRFVVEGSRFLSR